MADTPTPERVRSRCRPTGPARGLRSGVPTDRARRRVPGVHGPRGCRIRCPRIRPACGGVDSAPGASRRRLLSRGCCPGRDPLAGGSVFDCRRGGGADLSRRRRRRGSGGSGVALTAPLWRPRRDGHDHQRRADRGRHAARRPPRQLRRGGAHAEPGRSGRLRRAVRERIQPRSHDGAEPLVDVHIAPADRARRAEQRLRAQRPARDAAGAAAWARLSAHGRVHQPGCAAIALRGRAGFRRVPPALRQGLVEDRGAGQRGSRALAPAVAAEPLLPLGALLRPPLPVRLPRPGAPGPAAPPRRRSARRIRAQRAADPPAGVGTAGRDGSGVLESGPPAPLGASRRLPKLGCAGHRHLRVAVRRDPGRAEQRSLRGRPAGQPPPPERNGLDAAGHRLVPGVRPPVRG